MGRPAGRMTASQPWQERLLVFVALCAMVLYIAKVCTSFLGSGMRVSRALSDASSDLSGGAIAEDDAEDEHSD